MFLTLRTTALIIVATLLAQSSVVAADTPLVRSAKEVKWGAPPPAFPPSAMFAVIAGDPAATGLVTVRLEMPAGYTIPPHFHPTDEHVTVLKGSFSLGMGDVIDKGRSDAVAGRVCCRAGKHASLCVYNHRRDDSGAPARPVRNNLRQSGG